MSRSATKLVLVLAILYCGTMPSSPTAAQVSGKRASFIISNQNAKLACVGDAAIRGGNNELTITGPCLAGSNNKIKVTSDVGKVATVNVCGSVNAIFWSMPTENRRQSTMSDQGTG